MIAKVFLLLAGVQCVWGYLMCTCSRRRQRLDDDAEDPEERSQRADLPYCSWPADAGGQDSNLLPDEPRPKVSSADKPKHQQEKTNGVCVVSVRPLNVEE